VSFNATALPAGLSVNTSTGVISGTPNTTGTTSATISAINSGGTGSATLTIAVLPASQNPFETWEQTYFSAAQLLNPAISGDTACPFGDGIANLMKYALNLNPNTDGVSGLPVGEPMQIGGANYLTLKYTQVIAATDITYTVEVSGDLRTWNSGPGYTATVSAVNNPDGVTQTVIVQDLTPVTSGSMQFVRLRVTMP
jgi:hypothetical protein